jgi:hypothetical protein
MFCNKDMNDAVSFDLLISLLFQVGRFPVPVALKANILGRVPFRLMMPELQLLSSAFDDRVSLPLLYP